MPLELLSEDAYSTTKEGSSLTLTRIPRFTLARKDTITITAEEILEQNDPRHTTLGHFSGSITRMEELLDLLTKAEKSAEALGSQLASNAAVHAQVLDKARAIIRKVQRPVQRAQEIFASPYHLACLQAAFDAGWLRSIDQAGAAGRTVDDLAAVSGADHSLVRQILRYLAAHGSLNELGVDKYATTPMNSLLCTNDGMAAGLKHASDSYAFSAAHMPDVLSANGYKTPADAESTPYAQGHGLSFFKDLAERPALGRAFNKYLATINLGKKAWFDVYPIESLTVDKEDDIMLIDVGGGRGHELAALARKQLPGRLVLQDLPEVVSQVPGDWKTRFEAQAHDFFTPQPRKDARAYYMHGVMHDWNDEKCAKILSHTRDAMKPGHSTLLINELIIPDTGCSPHSASFDLVMMTVMGAKERTRSEWEKLIRGIAGLKIKRIYQLEESGESVLEVVREE